jgi:hypothetical protein
MGSSYQKRKDEIKFLEQCVGELEEKCRSLVRNKGKVLFDAKGMDGDHYITPYNNEEFNMELMMERPL